MTKERTDDPFDAFDAKVRDLVGPLTEEHAHKRSSDPPSGFRAQSLETLVNSMRHACWSKSTSLKNWSWRARTDNEKRGSTPEVKLERKVAELGGDTWTYQMPTFTGYLGSDAGKRRSIDLVKDHGGGHFSFVELKVGSDNPLYAAVECFRYLAAYLWAKEHHPSDKKDGGVTEDYRVMEAQRIDLVVLGPTNWYRFKKSRGSPLERYDNSWLVDAIAEWDRSRPSGPRIRLRFEEYGDSDDVDDRAREILKKLG